VGDVGGIEAEQKEIELLKKVAGRDAKYRARLRRTVAGEVEENMVISSLLLTFYASVSENWIRMRN
jgi:hypothetical protein